MFDGRIPARGPWRSPERGSPLFAREPAERREPASDLRCWLIVSTNPIYSSTSTTGTRHRASMIVPATNAAMIQYQKAAVQL